MLTGFELVDLRLTQILGVLSMAQHQRMSVLIGVGWRCVTGWAVYLLMLGLHVDEGLCDGCCLTVGWPIYRLLLTTWYSLCFDTIFGIIAAC